MAIEEEIATPPLSGVILPGVTRKSMIELARTWVWCERKEEGGQNRLEKRVTASICRTLA